MSVHRSLTRPDADLRVTDSGGVGTAVVLTHGAGMDRTSFAAPAAALAAAGYRVITWDLRGHGDSTLDPAVRFTAADALADLGALLEELRLSRPVLVGHSLGGNLSQAFVRAHPQQVGALVVVGAAWNAGPLSRLDRLGLALATPLLALIPASRRPRLMAKASAVTPGAVAATERAFSAMPMPRFLDVWRATVSLLDPEPGYRTPVPLALLRGEKDSTGTIATTMPRWARAEGVRERVITGAGHVVMLDAPDATSRALREVVEELSGS